MYKNTFSRPVYSAGTDSFNPCFNGTMYKNSRRWTAFLMNSAVSILVLMELCIKTFLGFVRKNI